MPKLKPKPEQLRGMQLIVSGKGARLFLHPGKGKTATVLAAFKVLKAKGYVDALLVIAPLRVITTTWPAQLEYWDDFRDFDYTTLHGDVAARMQDDVDVYLMNIEGLLNPAWAAKKPTQRGWTYLTSPTAIKFLQNKRFMLAIDESTKFKKATGERFKVLRKYLPSFSYPVIMTGKPQPKNLEDLFSQCYITDQGADLGERITHFRRKYMARSDDGFGYVAQEWAPEAVAKKIAPTTLQLEYEEAVPSQEVPIWVPMPTEVKKFYNELKKELLAEIQDKVVMAPNGGVLFNKLRQVAQGAIYDEDGSVIELHSAKLDALETLLEELNGEPALCLFQFRHDAERICKRLGGYVPTIASGTTAAQGKIWCQEFSEGKHPLMLGHPASIAHGVDGLQNSCGNLIFFGLDPSCENDYQARLRIVRQGSKHSEVFIYRIMVDCSIERALLKIVNQKEESEASFLSILRENLT